MKKDVGMAGVPAILAAAPPWTRLRRGGFRGLPADILTVLVWFDKKAEAYLER